MINPVHSVMMLIAKKSFIIKNYCLIFFLFSFKVLFAQEQMASPEIINYSSEDYNAGLQNWSSDQDKEGILYFGNNEGLLTFNGKFWKLYPLPNATVVRSLKIDDTGKIFVGGQDEFGYFFPNQQGVLKYHSLVTLLPANERKFADVWDIAIENNQILFRTAESVFQFKDGRVKVFKSSNGWNFMTGIHGQFLAQATGKGLMIFKDGVWEPFCMDLRLKGLAITGITEFNKDTLLMSTLKNGLFLIANRHLIKKTTSEDQLLYNSRIYCLKKVNKDWFAIGTTSSGMLIINHRGEIIQKYSYQEGLQKNNVRTLLLDQHKGLWIGLDDGIDYIGINSAIKYIYPAIGKKVTGYAAIIHDDKIFIGTSNGLYFSTLETRQKDLSLSVSNFNKIKDVEGQVWSLTELNDQLLMGHEDGLYQIKNGLARKIYKTGTWIVKPLSSVYPTKQIITGTYLGLQLLTYQSGIFVNDGALEGIHESLRFIYFDEQNNFLWASHPNRGIFKFSLSKDFTQIKDKKLYNHLQGLPFDDYNYVFFIKNRIMAATLKGAYEYDYQRDRFVPSKLLNPIAKLSLQYLKEDKEGNVWFVTNKRVGVLDFTQPTQPTIFFLPEMDKKVVGGFENIYPYDAENIFIGSSKGFFHVNYKKYKENISQVKVILSQISLFGKKDSLLFGGYFTNEKQMVVPQNGHHQREINISHDLNSIHFEFSSTYFGQQKSIQFSYQLVGFDHQWSAWSGKSEKDYTNLPVGFYQFKVKARNNLGNESVPVLYSFNILPAWYQTIWFNIFIFIFFSYILYLLFKFQQKRHIKEQNQLSYLHQLEIEGTEKEIVRLQKERLEADVNYKNKELSIMTMHLLQRGKVLEKIKEMILGIIKKHEITESSSTFRHLIKLIKEVEKSDEDWDQFTIHFNHANSDFFNKLKEQFPDLTPNELKICAYVKMNLSMKEIAQILNITTKAVEVGRYRLRKKLNISPEVNLYDFLLKIANS